MLPVVKLTCTPHQNHGSHAEAEQQESTASSAEKASLLDPFGVRVLESEVWQSTGLKG